MESKCNILKASEMKLSNKTIWNYFSVVLFQNGQEKKFRPKVKYQVSAKNECKVIYFDYKNI